jgi:hypothetical protein
VPRTSSGKISRSASRERYLAGAFRSQHVPVAERMAVPQQITER